MSERVDVGSIRRTQIVEAACRVIERKGIQGASLAEIEQEAGVSRGVLTYHFPSKEAIILAVFDATIARIHAEAGMRKDDGRPGWERLENIVEFLLTAKPRDDDFDCLQYTFLAQMSHREDFRERLAAEYADIRRHIAEDVADLARRAGLGTAEIEAAAAVIHGMLSGLIIQLNVDPTIADPKTLVAATRRAIQGLFQVDAAPRTPAAGKRRKQTAAE